MKTPIVLSVVMALLLCAGSVFVLSYAQDPATDDKPTFYRLTPGTYVNGWPRFTIHYPKDWVERRPNIVEVFRAGNPRGLNECRINMYPVPAAWSTGTAADEWVQGMKAWGAPDATVVSDKPSQLQDGTPAQEVMLHLVVNGEPVDALGLMTKKAVSWSV
jgi:hypothetical protein